MVSRAKASRHALAIGLTTLDIAHDRRLIAPLDRYSRYWGALSPLRVRRNPSNAARPNAAAIFAREWRIRLVIHWRSVTRAFGPSG